MGGQDQKHLITSTSDYLRNVAERIRAQEGKSTDDLMTEVLVEMAEALVMPRSDFRDSEEIVGEYGEGGRIFDLSEEISRQLAGAYILGLNQAMGEGRYFGRSDKRIDKRFEGDREKARSELTTFLGRHGLTLTDEARCGSKKIGPGVEERLDLLASDLREGYFTSSVRVNGEKETLTGREATQPIFGQSEGRG